MIITIFSYWDLLLIKRIENTPDFGKNGCKHIY